MGEAKRRRAAGYDPRTTSAQDRAAEAELYRTDRAPSPYLSIPEFQRWVHDQRDLAKAGKPTYLTFDQLHRNTVKEIRELCRPAMAGTHDRNLGEFTGDLKELVTEIAKMGGTVIKLNQVRADDAPLEGEILPSRSRTDWTPGAEEQARGRLRRSDATIDNEPATCQVCNGGPNGHTFDCPTLPHNRVIEGELAAGRTPTERTPSDFPVVVIDHLPHNMGKHAAMSRILADLVAGGQEVLVVVYRKDLDGEPAPDDVDHFNDRFFGGGLMRSQLEKLRGHAPGLLEDMVAALSDEVAGSSPRSTRFAFEGNPNPVAPRYQRAHRHEGPNKPDKGQFDGSCNRTACQRPLKGQNWWNRSTRQFYCQTCAHELNRANPPRDCVDWLSEAQLGQGDALCIFTATPAEAR